MQDNFNTFSKIEDYLNENLSEVERTAFEKEMASNPELQTLVDDYDLVDVFIEQNEILTINNKLSQIHKGAVLRKNWIKGMISLAAITLVIATYLLIPKNNTIGEVIEIKKEDSKSISFLISEPTPFKIMDSMSEAELSTSIQNSKDIAGNLQIFDSILPLNKMDEQPVKIDSISTKKLDSIIEPEKLPQSNLADLEPDSTEKIKVRQECELELTSDNIEKLNSCSETGTGSIQFTKTNSDYSYSINDKGSYSSNPNFTSLREGNYLVSIKSKSKQCESKSVEVAIEGYTCNYIIHPEQFIYLEKSLDKFKEVNFVEVFVFNRNGNLVFNKKIPTSEKFYWEGNSNTGSSTPMGNYTYLIKSGNKVSTGEITIIR